MDKENVCVCVCVCVCVYTHSNTTQPSKKNEIISLAASWMDLEIIILSKVVKKREKQISYDITYMWPLKYDIKKYP